MAIHLQLTLCRRIRALRTRSGYTQEEIAEKLGISQAAYSRFEKGEVEISIMKLIALAEIYGVAVSDIVKDL